MRGPLSPNSGSIPEVICRRLEIAVKVAKNLGRIILIIVSAGLSGCAPSSIPSGASVHWGVEGGLYWTWTQKLKHGCAAWMAVESWANVQLLVDSQCDGKGHTDLNAERGLSYLSAEDHLTFQGYWPWTENDHFQRIIYDRKGMISSVRPCGYLLSENQISGMRIVTREAYNHALTNEEKRVLARIDQRLSALGNKALASGQGGCTDLPIDRDTSPVRDVWNRG